MHLPPRRAPLPFPSGTSASGVASVRSVTSNTFTTLVVASSNTRMSCSSLRARVHAEHAHQLISSSAQSAPVSPRSVPSCVQRAACSAQPHTRLGVRVVATVGGVTCSSVSCAAAAAPWLAPVAGAEAAATSVASPTCRARLLVVVAAAAGSCCTTFCCGAAGPCAVVPACVVVGGLARGRARAPRAAAAARGPHDGLPAPGLVQPACGGACIQSAAAFVRHGQDTPRVRILSAQLFPA